MRKNQLVLLVFCFVVSVFLLFAVQKYQTQTTIPRKIQSSQIESSENVETKKVNAVNITSVPRKLSGVVEHITYVLPEGWETEITNDQLRFSQRNGGKIIIDAYAYQTDVGRREYYCIITSFCIESTTTFTERTIGNLKGYAASGLDNSGGGGAYFGEKDGVFYVISHRTPLILDENNKLDDDAMKIAIEKDEQFLKSLKF